jgi:hypothetical protein
MKLHLKTKILFVVLLLTGCAQLVKFLDSESELKQTASGQTHLGLVFSHNIQGELEPCGCRQFPLGGLEQVWSQFEILKKTHPLFYLDTGDLFFPSSNLPQNVHASMELNARKLLQALEGFGLKLFVPGDQDFALGKAWLQKISQEARFTFLLSNLKNKQGWKSQSLMSYQLGERRLHFIGVIDPQLLNSEDASDFIPPEEALSQILPTLPKSPQDVVILLSHSGYDRDREYAEKFERLDWIIGAHSQSFIQSTRDIGRTKIIQAVSRNHYLGFLELSFSQTAQKTEQDRYQLIEIREDLKDQFPQNPMRAFLFQWRQEKNKLQALEQNKFSSQNFEDSERKNHFVTYNNCLDCHSAQADFWGSTAHAHAWVTLENRTAEFDASCIQCHSLGWQEKKGFQKTTERIQASTPEKATAYLQAFKIQLPHYKKSVRQLSKAERLGLYKKRLKDLRTQEVSHDFGHVQCLNCHVQSDQHPYDQKVTPVDYSSRCLDCHTVDQSPSWWEQKPGEKAKPKMPVVLKHIKDMSCPQVSTP